MSPFTERLLSTPWVRAKAWWADGGTRAERVGRQDATSIRGLGSWRLEASGQRGAEVRRGRERCGRSEGSGTRGGGPAMGSAGQRSTGGAHGCSAWRTAGFGQALAWRLV